MELHEGKFDQVEEIDEKDTSGTGYTHVEDPELEKKIVRHLDRKILPWIFALWLLAFIDRSNIGNAKIDGLIADLELTGNKYNISLTVFGKFRADIPLIFYYGIMKRIPPDILLLLAPLLIAQMYILYVLVDIPSNWLLKIVGGGKYLPMLALAWGIVGTCMGAVKSYGALIACRMLLGACEGGMFGGIILYLSMFYKRHQLMFRLGIFYCAAPLSGAFGGLLATGLAEIEFGGYNRWPWIFFVEGSLTIVVAIVAFFFLPDTPGKAKFLSEEEQWYIVHVLRADLSGAAQTDKVDEEKFSWAAVRMAILNVNTILMSMNFFLILIPIYSYSLFLPSIIAGLGYKRITAQLFTVPPNFLAFLVVLLASWISDRIKMRGPLMAAGLLLAAIGYIMQLAAKTPAVRYGGTFFVAAGIFPCSPLVLAWLSNNLAPHYVKATGLGFIVAFGNCGAFVATWSYLPEDAPLYVTGHAINIGAIGLSLVLTLVNMAYIRWENAARASGKRDHRLQGSRENELGYRHPGFRYTL